MVAITFILRPNMNAYIFTYGAQYDNLVIKIIFLHMNFPVKIKVKILYSFGTDPDISSLQPV